MSQEHKPITFNSPLEAGIRAVSILGAAYPQTYDLQRLVAFDYLLVHTGDIGGPDNLHPPTPMRSAELLVRRKLVEQSLLLMMTRDLVEREVTSEGIKYGAGENAATFLSSVSSNYLLSLKDRAVWLVETIGDLTDEQFKAMMRRFFDKWVEQFQSIEQSLGVMHDAATRLWRYPADGRSSSASQPARQSLKSPRPPALCRFRQRNASAHRPDRSRC